MGADFYLPDVLQACHQRYGRAAVLLEQLIRLAEGQNGQQIAEAGQQLKETLISYASQIGEMPLALFDQVTEAADLAQGELSAATRSLAAQVAALVQEIWAPPAEHTDDLGSPGPLTLTADLLAILTGRLDETTMRRGATLLAQKLLSLPEPAILRQAGQLIVDVLAGNSSGVLALQVEHRFLPTLEHLHTSQAESLRHLEEALAPLLPDLSTPPESGDRETPTARALRQFHQMALRLSTTIARLHQTIRASRQMSVDWHDTLTLHLENACRRLEDLWQEEEHLQTQTQAIEALHLLFIRTLSPSPDVLTSQNDQRVSPLQRAFGCLMEHSVLWPSLQQTVMLELETARTILAGDWCAALSEICSILVPLLAPEQTPFDRRSLLDGSISLTPSVQVAEADLMSYWYVQTMGKVQRDGRETQLQAWAEQALRQRPLLSSAPGLVLRFWRLLQSDGLLWSEVLAARLSDALQQPDALASGSPYQARLDALLAELQGLLADQPRVRIEALLSRAQKRVSEDSPLIPALSRLRALVQGDCSTDLATHLAHLLQEVDRHQEWPADRRHDVLWLLTLARSLWQTPQRAHDHLLCASLRAVYEEVGLRGTGLYTLLARGWPQEKEAGQLFLLDLLGHLQKVVPEEGPQVSYQDLRWQRDWKLRLLHTLLQTRLECEEQRVSTQSEHVRLLTPLLHTLHSLFSLWCFPADGYFHDPYNDTVRRSGAYEIAG